MKAIYMPEPWQIGIKEIQQRPLESGEALIKIRSAGICGSDINAFRGTNGLVSYPRVIGHELAGEILSVPENNPKGLKPGDRVTVDPYLYCGHCYPCSIGRTNCCNDLRVLGVHVDGGMAETFAHPANMLVKVPDDMPWDIIPLAEPLTIALHGLHRLQLKSGEHLAISGAGPIGLLAAIVAAEAPGSAVVTDSVTSAQLADFLTGRLGLIHRRFKRGYKNVINEGIRLNQEGTPCLLAIETSGHAAMGENYFLDDGAYVAVKLLIQAARLRREGRTLGALLEGLEEPLEAVEYRLPIRAEDFRAYGQQVLEGLEDYANGRPGWQTAPDNCEGLRISFPEEKGWFLLRMSLHDPLMPLNIESSRPGGTQAILDLLRPFLARWKELNLSRLP